MRAGRCGRAAGLSEADMPRALEACRSNQNDPKQTLVPLSKVALLSYVRLMILRRSVILALGSMLLLTRGVFSQTAVKVRRVGLLSSGAPFADTSEVVIGPDQGRIGQSNRHLVCWLREIRTLDPRRRVGHSPLAIK